MPTLWPKHPTLCTRISATTCVEAPSFVIRFGCCKVNCKTNKKQNGSFSMLTSRLLTGIWYFYWKILKFEIVLGWQNMWVLQNIFNVYSCLSEHAKACNQTMQNCAILCKTQIRHLEMSAKHNLMRGVLCLPPKAKKEAHALRKLQCGHL